jgi:hypothetical protein
LRKHRRLLPLQGGEFRAAEHLVATAAEKRLSFRRNPHTI